MSATANMVDLDETATLKRLTGDTGVFIGGEDDLEAARIRYEAIKAIQSRTATPEQRALVNDMDNAMQRASVGVPVPAPPPNYPPSAPRPPPRRPNALPIGVDATRGGIPMPPRHSRNL